MNFKHYFLYIAILISNTVISQVTATFTTQGTHTWTCPSGVTSISFSAYGAGGGGGGGGASNKNGGGGGGGGAYILNNSVSVTPGTTYTIIVGQGGTGGATTVAGGNGGFTRGTFGATIITANGGNGGNGYSSATSTGTGGAGGTGGTFNGGTGGTGTSGGSGGGGGSAGTTANGGNGGMPSAGSAGNGGTIAGAGAAGSTSNTASGVVGSNYGGGGSGGTKGSNGGNGANGYASITYTLPTNFTCATALNLPCATTNQSGSTVGSTSIAHGTGCSMANYGAWYTFVGDGQTTTITVTTTSYDVRLYVGTGTSCGSFSQITCVDVASSSGNETSSFVSTVGVTYYIYIAHYSSSSTTTGTFTISRTCGPAPIPPVNDNCSTATAFGTIPTNGTCVSLNNQSTVNGTNSFVTPTGACTSNDGNPDDDVWYSFVAVAPNVTLSSTYDSGSSDVFWQVLSGGCGSTMNTLFCTDNNSGGTVTGLTTGQTYYIRMFTYGTGNATQQDICLKTPPTPPSNDECTGATSLTINPYNSCSSETAGTIENALPSTNGENCYGEADDDVWYYFTATQTSHYVGINNVSGSTTDMMVSVYASSGSCASMSSTNILCENYYGAAGGQDLVTGLTIGQRYYVRIYSYTSTTGQNTDFDVCIQAPPTCASNLGSGNVSITSLPYSAAGQTTTGNGNEITSTNVSSCGAGYYFDGNDITYNFTPSTSGNVTFTLNSGTQGTSLTLFEGCPFTGTCIAFDQNYTDGVRSFCVPVNAGSNYYVVVDNDDYYATSIPSFTLNITAPAAGAPNDLPCNATTIFDGISYTGNNNCTTNASEPSTPGCWTSGNVNTVWYKFTAISTTMHVQTTLGTLSGTQIALYSGSCSALTFVSCNQSAPSSGCSSSTPAYSMLEFTSLTPGTTYYIRVDGRNNNMGTFNIVLNDGPFSATANPIYGQDCSSPIPICSNTMSVPNPSFSGTGNICDFTGTNNCTSGEKNSVWYSFTIGANGNLNFIIFPNDATNNSNGAETDYDWVLWKTSGAGAIYNCSNLNSGTPAACNYGSPGITGMSPDGNAPSPINTYFNSTFETSIPVVAGEEYILVVQNFESSASGFNLDFSSSSSGVIDFTPNTVYWTGATNTNFSATVSNWGNCSTVPACDVSAVITNSGFQPVITGVENVKDLTINAGATLTIQAGATLNVCGNFTNNGNLVCSPTSTVIFNGTNVTQNVSGNLVGNNKFGNLTVTKTGGVVNLNNNVTIGGNFLTSNTTSVFNSNNKYVKLAGHFTNNNGNTTYTNTGTIGTLEFIGTSIQNYNQGSSQLDLNYVTVNNSAGIGNGVFLITDMFIKNTTGNLILTLGTITTGTPNTSRKVHVLNTTPSCVSIGNTNSFVDGNLRRYVSTSGDYNWPVGNVSKGYQRAQTIFSVISGMIYIDSRFDNWPTNPPYTQNASECGVTWDQESENNGYWTMIPDAGTCTYDCTLYPLNATNTSGMSAWTIIKRTHTSPIDNTLWLLNGTCASSTATQVTRTGMTDFSFLGVDQSVTPLPIQLTYFDGKNEETYNVLEWQTASERDNDYFTIEKSYNGIIFEELNQVDGAGNSTSILNYHTFDFNPYPGITYYKLKQTDFNGMYTYSNVIAVTNEIDKFYISEIYPNPSNEYSNLDVFSPVNGVLLINIFDNSGRLIHSFSQTISQGNNQISFNINQFANGIYSVELNFDKINYNSNQKLIKN